VKLVYDDSAAVLVTVANRAAQPKILHSRAFKTKTKGSKQGVTYV
jgi:ureidoglycolate hydrolase